MLAPSPKFSDAQIPVRSCIVVLKGVPADICENCGEYYLSETTTESVLRYAEVVAKRGTELEIMRFAA